MWPTITGDVCRAGELVVGNSWFKKKDVYKYVVENGGRKGGRQGIDRLCFVT